MLYISDPLVPEEEKSDSVDSDNSQEKENSVEDEVDEFNFGRTLVRKDKFLSMSPTESFFCLLGDL